jgi:hypothetical protein
MGQFLVVSYKLCYLVCVNTLAIAEYQVPEVLVLAYSSDYLLTRLAIAQIKFCQVVRPADKPSQRQTFFLGQVTMNQRQLLDVILLL